MLRLRREQEKDRGRKRLKADDNLQQAYKRLAFEPQPFGLE
jgi:hypothetical protein